MAHHNRLIGLTSQRSLAGVEQLPSVRLTLLPSIRLPSLVRLTDRYISLPDTMTTILLHAHDDYYPSARTRTHT